MSRVEEHDAVDVAVGDRWIARPGLAVALKVGVVLVPLVASVAASVVVAGWLPMPGAVAGQVLWWAVVLATSTLVLIAGEGAARRVLPLVGLLRLSLLFPGRAPSRLAVARTGTRRELEELSGQVRLVGLGPDAEQASVTLVRLIAALDAHDRRTRGHSERVRAYADLLAHRLHLPPEDANKLRWAALLHDIGKLSVPAEVLNKPGRLTPDEWALIHAHPAEGDRMLGALRDWLGPWALVVLEHHERWDGTGYPAGLAADEISLGARLVAVADSYDVMTSVRSYQPQPRTPAAARSELVRCSGTQFDPWIVRCFLNVSTRHLWWLLGPATWLAQIPWVGKAAAAGLRRPAPAPAGPPVSLVRMAGAALAVALVVPGFGPGGPGRLPPAGVQAAAAEAASAPSSAGRSATGSSRPAPPPALGPVGVHQAPPAVPTTVPAPAPTTTAPAGAPAPDGATGPATTPPAAPPAVPVGGGDRPTTASAGPSPSSPRPTAGTGSGGPSPTITVPTAVTTPPHHGRGVGHVKGKGKGHDRHDANGDGIDDKAGALLDPLLGLIAAP
jgi:hypothetical protein